jgi:NitT/TauT family transport system substrate-binding protein
MEAGGNILVEEKETVTTALVARAEFLSTHRDLVHRFVQAHRELTDWIRLHPQEAQNMIRDELKTGFRVNMSPELIARAWTRMSMSSDISPSALQVFVANAQQAGFLRAMPELSNLIEVP